MIIIIETGWNYKQILGIVLDAFGSTYMLGVSSVTKPYVKYVHYAYADVEH